MQLMRQSDYSLRVLIYLALNPDHIANISDIAATFNISRNHLVKVVHQLSKLGYILTLRGRGGGIKLAQAAKDISVGSVVRDTENSLDVINCKQPVCPILPACRLKGVLNEATETFLTTLDGYTIADLIQQKDKLNRLLA
ncbi:MAG: Rrf2 family transcriptional regulator [Gammaproteobacteria bacterium]